jgi:hypothetical protein
VIPQGIDPKLIDALNRASSLELFQLSTLVQRMLADPRRILAVRTNLHSGQIVRFLDWRSGQMRDGRVIAMADANVTLYDQSTRQQWKLPYAAIEPPTANSAAAPAPTTATPSPARPGRGDFRNGQKVSFEDKYLQTHVGTVVRINQRTATVDPDDGTTWRVAFAHLRHVVDI